MTDPLRDPESLIRRVYAYAAYRLGHGADAEDVTSETFERALRYRTSYDPSKGSPSAWLVGIARRCIADRARPGSIETPIEVAGSDRVELEPADLIAARVDLRTAVSRLPSRDRELVALRYGADLDSRAIATHLEMTPGAVDVALHRALERLRALLEPD